MSLVALGACLFAILGESVAEGASEAARSDAVSRVLQGLVGGIGFLGAATVFRNNAGSHGVTTAATVWVVAAIGASCGLGLYVPAATVTGVAVFILLALKPLEQRVTGRHRRMRQDGESPEATPEARSPPEP
jgi:putative Mg2+ transporter-C (MgtC) family protein